MLAVYITPFADAAADQIQDTVYQLETKNLQALISGDLNHASLSATLPNFK